MFKLNVISATENPIVFLDINVGDERAGKIMFKLFADVMPKHAENFQSLCTGDRGVGTCGKKLCYQGSEFHVIEPGVLVVGGDFVNGDGTGGESTYHTQELNEINPRQRHVKAGLLSVPKSANLFKGSQFAITLDAAPHLDESHVVIGKFVKGSDTLRLLRHVKGDCNKKPLERMCIKNCGIYPRTGVITQSDTSNKECGEENQMIKDLKEALTYFSNVVERCKASDFASGLALLKRHMKNIELSIVEEMIQKCCTILLKLMDSAHIRLRMDAEYLIDAARTIVCICVQRKKVLWVDEFMVDLKTYWPYFPVELQCILRNIDVNDSKKNNITSSSKRKSDEITNAEADLHQNRKQKYIPPDLVQHFNLPRSRWVNLDRTVHLWKYPGGKITPKNFVDKFHISYPHLKSIVKRGGERIPTENQLLTETEFYLYRDALRKGVDTTINEMINGPAPTIQKYANQEAPVKDVYTHIVAILGMNPKLGENYVRDVYSQSCRSVEGLMDVTLAKDSNAEKVAYVTVCGSIHDAEMVAASINKTTQTKVDPLEAVYVCQGNLSSSLLILSDGPEPRHTQKTMTESLNTRFEDMAIINFLLSKPIRCRAKFKNVHDSLMSMSDFLSEWHESRTESIGMKLRKGSKRAYVDIDGRVLRAEFDQETGVQSVNILKSSTKIVPSLPPVAQFQPPPEIERAMQMGTSNQANSRQRVKLEPSCRSKLSLAPHLPLPVCHNSGVLDLTTPALLLHGSMAISKTPGPETKTPSDAQRNLALEATDKIQVPWKSLPIIALVGLPPNTKCTEVVEYIRSNVHDVNIAYVIIAAMPRGLDSIALVSVFSETQARNVADFLPWVPFKYSNISVVYLGDHGPSEKIRLISDGPQPRHTQITLLKAIQVNFVNPKEVTYLGDKPVAYDVVFGDTMNAATVILRYLQNWYHLKSTNAHDRYYHIDGRAYVKIHEKPTRICFAPYVPIRTKFDSIDMNSVAETDIVESNDTNETIHKSTNQLERGHLSEIEAISRRLTLVRVLDACDDEIENDIARICYDIGNFSMERKEKTIDICFKDAREAFTAASNIESLPNKKSAGVLLRSSESYTLQNFNLDELKDSDFLRNDDVF